MNKFATLLLIMTLQDKQSVGADHRGNVVATGQPAATIELPLVQELRGGLQSLLAAGYCH